MAVVDLETLVADFLAFGKRLQALRPPTGERVIAELIRSYRESRVAGAALDQDADMLLLQWGASQQLDIAEPSDLRGLDDGSVRMTDDRVQYLDFTRQVFVPGYDDEEFDDAAIQMSVSLCYGLANGREPNSNLWIATPVDIDARLDEFHAVEFVKSLLTAAAQRAVIKVFNCG